MDFKELNNGVKMPIQGFGVFQIPDATECERVLPMRLPSAIGSSTPLRSMEMNGRSVWLFGKVVFRVRNCSSRPKHGFQKWVMNGHCEH